MYIDAIKIMQTICNPNTKEKEYYMSARNINEQSSKREHVQR